MVMMIFSSQGHHAPFSAQSIEHRQCDIMTMMINDRRQGMIMTTIKFIILIIVVIAHLFCRENTNPAYFQANEILQNLINVFSALPLDMITNDANNRKRS